MVFSNRRTNPLGATLAVGLTLFSGLAFAAEQRSANDIINALKSPRVTRGLTTSPADAARAADETQFIDALRNRPTRSLSTRSETRSHRLPARNRKSIWKSTSSTTRP